MTKKIFVFGSNLAGRHGKGSALEALKHHGAIYGQGKGLQGNSYGIPTKNRSLKRLPLKQIKMHVEEFLRFAIDHPEYEFNVVAVGCGLAGFSSKTMSAMFANYPKNVNLPRQFLKHLEGEKQ